MAAPLRGAIAQTAASLAWRPLRWPLLFLQLAVAIAAGGLHAAGWLWPGAWLPVWAGQALLVALSVSVRPKWALLYGSLAGGVGIAASFYWGVEALRQAFDASLFLGWSIFLLLVAMEATGFGAFCWTTSRAAHRGMKWLWICPCAWVAIERWFPRVFPWKLGYSQLEVLPLLQIAELVGSTGIGFVMTAVAMTPVLLVLAFRQQATLTDRRWALRYCTGTAFLLAATITFGVVRISQFSYWEKTQPKLKVGLIQIDPSYRGSEKRLRERSLALHQQVDLLCWPESALGCYCDELANFRDRRQTMRLSRQSLDYLEPAKDFASHLLAGGKQYGVDAAEEGPYAMTAFLINPAQDIVGRYRKRTLLPFGEYIPLQSWFPSLRHWATLQEVFEAGTDAAPLVTDAGNRLGVVICYEDTLPKNARQTVACGAEAIFSLIQGNAFENPLTLVQHQRLAVLRAVENRRYFVRCASTGMSCVIAPTGQIVGELPPQQDGTLVAEIALSSERTLYSRMGDLFPICCTILAAVGILLSRRLR